MLEYKIMLIKFLTVSNVSGSLSKKKKKKIIGSESLYRIHVVCCEDWFDICFPSY